jgi:hypothetical protein
MYDTDNHTRRTRSRVGVLVNPLPLPPRSNPRLLLPRPGF